MCNYEFGMQELIGHSSLHCLFFTRAENLKIAPTTYSQQSINIEIRRSDVGTKTKKKMESTILDAKSSSI